MGRVFLQSVEGPSRFLCGFCKTPLVSSKYLVCFNDDGLFNEEYIFSRVPNVIVSSEDDINCCHCNHLLGLRTDRNNAFFYILAKSMLTVEVEQIAPPIQ